MTHRTLILPLSILLALSLVVCLGCEADAAPISAQLTVVEAGVGSPVRVGTTCSLRMQPAWRSGVNCQVILRCSVNGEDVDLFGGRRIGGYAVCETREHAFVSAFDGEPMRDGDPAVTVNLDERTITWTGAHDGETASLEVVGDVEVIAAWDVANID